MANPLTKLQETYRGLEHMYGPYLARKMLIDKISGQLKEKAAKVIPGLKSRSAPNPWDKSFEERVAILNSSNRKKVVIFYPLADQGTFRYRVYNVFQIINSHLTDCVASYFYSHEIEAFLEAVNDYDVVITSRFDFNPEFEKLVAAAKTGQVPVIYDIDDLLFDINYLPEIVKHLDIPQHEIPIWEDRITRNHQAAAQADSLLCTNEFLAQKLRSNLDKTCHVIPNFLNQEQLDFATQFQKPKSDKFWLGYFSGSSSHYKDFEMIEAEIVQVLDIYQNINLRLVGYIRLSQNLQKYRNRIEIIGLKDFMGYLEILGTCDLVLVPLVVSDFTNCKSELKYFEAGLMKVPVITSPTYIYQQVIREGENGMTAAEGEWATKIEQVYEDKELYQQISRNAYRDSIDSYSGEKIASQIHQFLKSI